MSCVPEELSEMIIGEGGTSTSLPPNFGVVRIKIGSFGATFCTGVIMETSGRSTGCDGSVTATSTSNNPVPTTSIGVGRGKLSADCTRACPNSRGENLSDAVGRPACSSTCANAPKSALTGSNFPERFANAAATVSPANGTSPVIDSTRIRASE